LKDLIRSVESLFQSYQFGEAGRQIYDFFWSEFADWYLEIAKLQLAEKGDRAYYTAETMVYIFDSILRMLHPFTPFVTEEIWGYLKRAAQEHLVSFKPLDGTWPEAMIVASWPQPLPEEGWETKAIHDFQQIQEIVRSIRNLRAEKNVKAATKISAIFSGSTEMIELLRSQAGTVASLSSLDPKAITLVDSSNMAYARPEGSVALVAGTVEIYLPMADLVDSQEEIARLTKELSEVQSQITRLEALLGGPFAEKAPAQVIAKEREKLAAFQITAEKLKTQLDALG
jgi:valyl-tRNA synthetase